MRMTGVVPALALLASVAAAAIDPLGDDFGEYPGVDLVGLSACQSGTSLTIRLDFSAPITAPPSLLSNAVYGAIDIDVDRDPATGAASRTDDSNPAGAVSGLGIELLVDLYAYDAETGTTTMRIIDTTERVDVPVVFATQSLSVTIPLSPAQAPNGVNIAAVVGNIENATDVVPNLGSITSEPCCGNGELDPGEDCDDGSECCNAACLFADGTQCGDDVCTQRGTCTAGVCTGGGAPLDCDDGDPCFDDTCEAPGGCAHTDRTGVPGAACAFARALPTACGDTPPSRRGFEKAGGLVTKAATASTKKRKALLRKARKGLKKFVKQIAKLEKKGKVGTGCSGGLQGQANDAVRRIERALAGG
ncbi:MAG: hypothetical protein KIT14_02665 [bacterium]|nr:hypothetical protein [bacterium]